MTRPTSPTSGAGASDHFCRRFVAWKHQLSSTGVLSNFDVSADGKSVVALVPATIAGGRERDHVTVVLNLFDALHEAD